LYKDAAKDKMMRLLLLALLLTTNCRTFSYQINPTGPAWSIM
jgi:hypothetical protein